MRSRPGTLVRESVLWFVLTPILLFYLHRRASGRGKLGRVRGPVIFAANHTSHLDTPVILAALPWRFRKRTVVAAAADYFYRKRSAAMLVSLLFNTVPMERQGGGLDHVACAHVDRLLDRGWSLLLYPEGTRSRSGSPGRVRRGAAVLAKRHGLQIVPIRVTGTREAMPPGHFWPHRKRRRARDEARRHQVSIAFGDPIVSRGDPTAVTETVRRFFEGTSNGSLAETAHRTPSGSYAEAADRTPSGSYAEAVDAPRDDARAEAADRPVATVAHHAG